MAFVILLREPCCPSRCPSLGFVAANVVAPLLCVRAPLRRASPPTATASAARSCTSSPCSRRRCRAQAAVVAAGPRRSLVAESIAAWWIAEREPAAAAARRERACRRSVIIGIYAVGILASLPVHVRADGRAVRRRATCATHSPLAARLRANMRPLLGARGVLVRAADAGARDDGRRPGARAALDRRGVVRRVEGHLPAARRPTCGAGRAYSVGCHSKSACATGAASVDLDPRHARHRRPVAGTSARALRPASGAPCTNASTVPSRRLRTQPATP